MPVRLVAFLTVLAAAVRFATLDAQSLWYDEALTLDLVNLPFGDMLDGVFASQAQPPTYFVLQWLWSQAFGDGEVGLRSLSALLGTLTVPVAYAIAHDLVGRRTALAVGALSAFSPALVWYSQEARAYALVSFLCAVALLCFVRGLERRSGRLLAGWVVASLLAVASHYFALCAVLPHAAWLLWRLGERRLALRALAGLGAGLVAILPMLLHQQESGGVDWIGEIPLWPRVRDFVFFFVAGPEGMGPMTGRRPEIFAIAVVFFVPAAAAALAWADGRVRRGLLLLLAVAAGVIALPLAASVVGGPDYVLDRNFLPAWVPLTIVVAAALCAPRLRWAGPAVVAGVCLVFAAIVIGATPRNAERQRNDWRSVAEHVGPARDDRVFVVSPYWQANSLHAYLPRLGPMWGPTRVTTVVTLELESFVPHGGEVTTIAPPPPFRQTRYSRVQDFTVVEYTAPQPVLLDPEQLAGEGVNRGVPFLEPAA